MFAESRITRVTRRVWWKAVTFALFSKSFGVVADNLLASEEPNSNERLFAENDRRQSFVRRDGNSLTLEGRDFYFSGTNQYYLFYKSQPMVDAVLEDASKLGVTVLRTWAFCDGQWPDGTSLQPAPRQYHEAGFRRLDYVIYKAKLLGLRVILPFVNNWDDFGGMNRYVQWSSKAREHDDFYSDEETRSLYRDYINYLLWRTNFYTGVRYKDEPTILAWELANEPRVHPSRAEAFYRWIDEMSAYVKSIDDRHLLSTGSEGEEGTDFLRTHSSEHIDLSSFHLYPETRGMDLDRSLTYIQTHAYQSLKQLNKPIYVGEFGLRDQARRNEVYQRWYSEFDRLGLQGAMFWLLSSRQEDGSLYPDYDGFTLYYPSSESTIPIVQDFNRRMLEKSLN